MSQVYIARKSCGHIVFACTADLPYKQMAEVMKQVTLAGLRLELSTDGAVQDMFATACDCNRPPLLTLIKEAQDEGVDQDSVDALAQEAEADGVEDMVDEAMAEEASTEQPALI